MCTAITRRLAGLARETRRLRARQPVSRDDPRSARSFYRGFVIRSPARGLARFLWKERSSADGGPQTRIVSARTMLGRGVDNNRRARQDQPVPRNAAEDAPASPAGTTN